LGSAGQGARAVTVWLSPPWMICRIHAYDLVVEFADLTPRVDTTTDMWEGAQRLLKDGGLYFRDAIHSLRPFRAPQAKRFFKDA
jgi:hypothetical protein